MHLHVLLVGAALRQGEVLSTTNSPKGKKPVPAFLVAVPKKRSVLQGKLLGSYSCKWINQPGVLCVVRSRAAGTYRELDLADSGMEVTLGKAQPSLSTFLP